MFISFFKRVFSFVFPFNCSNEDIDMATITKSEKTINIVLSSKGGIGKSFVSALMCQVYKYLKIPYLGVDMDPANETLKRFKSLNVEVLKMMNKDDSAVNQGAFDGLVERCYKNEMAYVFDIGSNAYLTMANYLKDGAGFKLLVQNGYKVTIHIVVAGGQDLADCLKTIVDCQKNLDGKIYNFVIWLNEYSADIVYEEKVFKDFKSIAPIYDTFDHVVLIPREPQLRRDGIAETLNKSFTFDDAKNDSGVNIVMRGRISDIEGDYLKIASDALGLELGS